MVHIGLDLSINSTGVCVYNDKTNEHKYYIISSHLTKKQKEFKHKDFTYIEYEKQIPQKDEDYIEKEKKKTHNICFISNEIEKIVKSIRQDKECSIEGISYGSTSSSALADLSGLNYVVRAMLVKNNVKFNIISPMQNKKFAVGIGNADKDVMVNAWKNCQPKFKNIPELKVDDIADAYFLAHFKTLSI